MIDNLWTENSLVNGTISTVRDIMWSESQDTLADIPTAIMIQIDGYDRPVSRTKYLPCSTSIQVQVEGLYP
jgi:hypothetical protein